MFFGGMPGGGGRMPQRPQRAEADTTGLYTLLGVAKEADAAEIKKAYRKAALQHHPDRGGDPEKFKELSKAHEILSDPEKRALYDEGGEEALEGGGGGGGGAGGMDLFDLFGGGMFGGRGGQRPGQKKKGEDVVFPLKVSLNDLYTGANKKLRLTKNVLCSGCKGKGGKNGADAVCAACKGQGMRMALRQIGPGMIQQVPQRCAPCSGTGSTLSEADKCQVCHGDRTVKEKKTLDVYITKGQKHGTRITFKGEADEAPNTIAGDVVVVLQQTEHPSFRRDGAQLFVKQRITLLEALTGFSFTLTHLDGRVLRVSSEPGMVCKPGQTKCLRDEGMPLVSNPYSRGHLWVEMEVDFPQPGQLDDKALRALSAVLPRAPKVEVRPSQPPPKPDGSGLQDSAEHPNLQPTYDVVLETVADMAAERRRNAEQEAQHNTSESYDEDEDEHAAHARRGGGGQAGCQQQ